MQADAFADAVVVMVKNALGPVLERLASMEARLTVLGDVRDRLVMVETKAAVVAPPVEIPDPVDLLPVLERIAATEARISVLGDIRDRLVVVETKSAVPITVVPQELPAPVDVSPILERLAALEARLDTIGDLRDRVVTVETKMAQPLPVVDVSDVRERLSAVEADLKVVRVPAFDAAPLLEKHDALGAEVSALRERVAVAETRQFIPGPMGRDGQPGRDGKDGTNGTDGVGYDDLAVEQIDERTIAVKAMRGLQVRELGTFVFPVEIYRGVYIEGKTYDRGDGVTWGGSEWHCNETTTTKPGDGSKAWTLKVKRGRDGKDGRDAMAVPVVSAGKR